MGYSQSSIAVKGKSPTVVLELLGAQRTGSHEEFAESPLVGAELPGGWYLVVSQRDKLSLMDDSFLRDLSTDCEVVACFVEEHVMYSAATCWRNGQRLWSVIHNAQDKSRSEHLETEGDMPPMFSGIHERWRSEQQKAGGRKASVDYIFEIPVELAHAFTGYRHDRDVAGLSERPFEVLASAGRRVASISDESKPISWWSRLFRR